MPFGLKNAVPCFQHIIEENDCNGTHAYLDNIKIGGKTQKEHDENLHHFLNVAKQ